MLSLPQLLLRFTIVPVLAGTVLALPEKAPQPEAWWDFNLHQERRLLERVHQVKDLVSGYFGITEGIRGGALRFDGLTTAVLRPDGGLPALDHAFTIEAWVALQSYPWNDTAIFSQALEKISPPREDQFENPHTFSRGLIGVIYGEPDFSDGQSIRKLLNLSETWTGGAKTWSAKWFGYLEGPHTGAVEIHAEADDDLELLVEGRLVLRGNGSATVEMVQGRWYPIQINYSNNQDPAYLRLNWAWKGTPPHPIPSTALLHTPKQARLVKELLLGPEPKPEEFQPRILFGVNAQGHPFFEAATAGGRLRIVSPERVPLLRWTHLAATFQPGGRARVYLDGAQVVSARVPGELKPFRSGPLAIGCSLRRMAPAGTIREANRKVRSLMVLEGLLDELKIYDQALPPQTVALLFRKAKPSEEQPISFPRLPTGPNPLTPRFDAFYTRLWYTKLWEAPWRVGRYPDIVVTFDRAPIRLLFWRGTNYGAAWVAENGRWMSDQSLERSGGTRWGTAEHMNDKQTRHSHVRLIFNHAARKVIHWRYALTDIKYEIARIRENGWGEWADEYYTIYPDGVATRRQILHTDDLHHEWQETIVINPPGTRPEDNLNIEALILVNLAGESHTYSWAKGVPKQFDRPKDASIQLTNLKARFKPFIIFEPDPMIKPFTASIRPAWSHFPWWNHWPVAMLPNDGRNASGPGRPSHSSLTQSIEDSNVIRSLGEQKFQVVTLVGMTDRPISDLVRLARSWLQPPRLEIVAGSASVDGYDVNQRAYRLSSQATTPPTALTISLHGSRESPVFNPVLVLSNWGRRDARVRVEKPLPPARAADYRVGFEQRLEGTDLIIWLGLESETPVTFHVFTCARQDGSQ